VRDFDDHAVRRPEELRAEASSNRVAGAMPIPRDAPLAESAVRDRG
jgi:hypothetical protein